MAPGARPAVEEDGLRFKSAVTPAVEVAGFRKPMVAVTVLELSRVEVLLAGREQTSCRGADEVTIITK